MNRSACPIAVLGGGLTGSLLALFLARRGYRPVVFDRRGDLRIAPPGGRSINLALAARGVRALESVGLMEAVKPLLTPMRGRMLHAAGGDTQFQAYGQRPEEEIYSVCRGQLNALLLEHAITDHGIEYRFEWEALALDPDHGITEFRHPEGRESVSADVILAADGAGSLARRTLQARGACLASEQWLPHGYKELTLPADPRGGHRLEPHALHIWPRGGFMLIALPNSDGTFTCTLFLPHDGEPGFQQLLDPAAVESFFGRQFPDVCGLIPDVASQFLGNPTGRLATVRCRPWSYGHRVLLIGDAAHAVVPFHGQGMNCAFEDCRELDGLIDQFGVEWSLIFERFESKRIVNANAIADMALENYVEMRDTVRDPRFQLMKSLAFELERRFPRRFVPRYSMVMFHPEIPYAEAQRRGRIQARILERLTREVDNVADVDYRLANRLVEQLL